MVQGPLVPQRSGSSSVFSQGPGEEWHGFGAEIITSSSCLTCFVYGGTIPALVGSSHSVYVPQSTGLTPNMIKSAPVIINKTNGGKEPLSLLASMAQMPSRQA